MITIKDERAQSTMLTAGKRLAEVFVEIETYICPGITTFELDEIIDTLLVARKLVSQSKGYMGYRHASCISINDEVVHGVPVKNKVLKNGDLVKIDICAAWNGYCADMARCFFVGGREAGSSAARHLVDVAYSALDCGIEYACEGKQLGDISAAIQQEVEKHGFGVVRSFAGHGIGRSMHEDP